jgi:general secretion pathway protein D
MLVMSALLAGACATAAPYQQGQRAERALDYDRAVVEYTKAVRAKPDDNTARLALDRARLRAAEQHFFRGRRLAAVERYEDALIELQVAAELNPSSGDVDAALRDARLKVRAKLAVSREGKTELQSLIDRTRTLAPPGLDLPTDVKLPDSLVFSNASSRMVFMALARFTSLSVVFDPAFRDQPITVDLRKNSLEDALTSLTASTHTFYRVTAQRTITIVPDTPAKRREYEESVVRTFYLSNADVKEVIDLLRVVVDVRQISPITATNAISLKDTPERIAAADQSDPIGHSAGRVSIALLSVGQVRRQHPGLGQSAHPDFGRPSGTGTLRRTSAGADDHVHPVRSGRRQSAADHLVRLPEHWREHRHHATDASRRRTHAGAEDFGDEPDGDGVRRSPDIRQPRGQHDDSTEGR